MMKYTLVVLCICLEFINCASCANLPYSGKNEIESETEAAGCKCKNGHCEEDEKGKEICKCPPEYGIYTSLSCQKCNCGKDANCTWIPGIFMDTKICFCKEGYKDINGTCKDPCTPNPCKYDGKCSIESGKLYCTCKPPYSGDLCEKDPCTPNPCKYNGKCSIKSGKLNCTCKPPYSGHFCEKAGSCSSYHCHNGGVCKDEGDGPACYCKYPFSGERCEKDPDPCYPNPCINNGQCAIENGKAKCICKYGYTGDKCGIALDPCYPDPCKNNGHCANEDGKYKCFCKDRYTGDVCEIDPDPCYPNPCLNNGQCANENGKAKCICKYGYTGDKCGIALDPCYPDPCKNNGHCANEDGKYKCFCKDGYIYWRRVRNRLQIYDSSGTTVSASCCNIYLLWMLSISIDTGFSSSRLSWLQDSTKYAVVLLCDNTRTNDFASFRTQRSRLCDLITRFTSYFYH